MVSSAARVSSGALGEGGGAALRLHHDDGQAVRHHVVQLAGDPGPLLGAGDDGTGTPAGGGTGNGLRGMRERAALLGGEVTAGPGPHGGYRVRARIPLDPAGTG